MPADQRPSVLERAFALADSGRFNNLNELRAALKAERYGDEQFLGSAQLRRQMAMRIANAKSGSEPVPARHQILTEGDGPPKPVALSPVPPRL